MLARGAFGRLASGDRYAMDELASLGPVHGGGGCPARLGNFRFHFCLDSLIFAGLAVKIQTEQPWVLARECYKCVSPS